MVKNDINYFEACEKYPDFSKFIILKMDMQRRGYVISDKAMQLIKHRGIWSCIWQFLEVLAPSLRLH